MDRLLTGIALALALGLTIAGAAHAADAGPDEAKAAYYAAADKAAADYRDAHALCDTLNGNAQAVCIEEAKLAQTRAKATAEAAYRNTPQARLKASTDIANAEYAVAKAKCESMEEKEKYGCMREANALKIAAIFEAKAAQKQ